MNEREIFSKALEIQSEADREKFLAEACGDDSPMQVRIQELLSGVDSLGDFLEQAPIADVAGAEGRGESSESEQDQRKTFYSMTEDFRPRQQLGASIGPYKLLQELGHGGMGVVYMAEQMEPVQRRVALKVIKPGMDSRKVIARFEAERQALALMEHQNIARVLDAGTTATGQPFFVMELVKGVAITKYCDENRLSLRERLQLLIPVCQAIQHAHQKGIIHRDIKPTNILVTLYDGNPVPKVIDFGVAKATQQKLTQKTMFTEIGQVVGTLEYMSPEQAEVNQLDVDTRSDVYSLGVLLYELLTGTTPICREQLREVGFNEMLRTIRESEPPKPSTRLSQSGEALSSISAVRQIEPARISRFVRGDLDWIVMKSLEKDRTRRYDSAASLARDIEHFLQDEPVDAGPPSASYRLQKFVRKHRTGITVATALLLMLLVCTTVSVWQAIVAAGAARVARKAEAIAREEQDRAEESEREAQQQRIAAVESERIATIERDRAKQNEEQAYWNLYTARMQQAQSAWQDGDVAEARRLLDLYRTPGEGIANIRGLEWHYLDRKTHQELRTMLGHAIRVRCVAFSPHGSRLASAEGGWDNLEQTRTIRIWDVGTGDLVRTLDGPDANINDVKFSPDGRFLASVSHGRWTGSGEARELTDALLQIWETDGYAEVLRIDDPETRYTSLEFSPDGLRLVATATDRKLRNGRIQTWSVGDWEPVATFELPNTERAAPVDVAFAPDGLSIAVVGNGLDGVKILDASNGELLRHLDISNDPDVASGAVAFYPPRAPYCEQVCFHPDGKQIATDGHASNTILIWDLASGDVRRLRPSRSYGTEDVRSLTSSPDGRSIVSAGGRVVRIWSWDSGREVRTFWGHTDTVFGVAVSADALRIASCGNDQSVRIWDVTDPLLVPLQGIVQAVRDISFEMSGQRVAIAASGYGPRVSLWDRATGKLLNTLPAVTECLRISPDGRRLVTSSADHEILVWNLATREIQHRLTGHTKTVRNVEFSPDGRLLAAGSGNCNEAGRDYEPGKLTVWNTESMEPVFTTDDYVNQAIGSTSRHCHIAFSRDSRLMAAITGQPEAEQPFQTIRVWNTASWEEIQSIDCRSPRVYGLAFDHEGQRIATIFWPRGGLRIFDIASGEETLNIVNPSESFNSLQFSKEGNRILAGAGIGLLVLDSKTGEQICHVNDRLSLPLDGDDYIGVSNVKSVNLLKLSPMADEDFVNAEAQRLVNYLARAPMQKDEVVRRLGEIRSISDTVRNRALDLAESLNDEPIAFYLAAWAIIENSSRPRDAYVKALDYATTATELASTDAKMLTARGFAEFRLGDFEQALSTLEAALQQVTDRQDATPILGLLAMTQFRLGNTDEAVDLLSRGEANLAEYNDNWRSVSFILEEARTVIGD